MKQIPEFEKFDKAMSDLVSVTHDKIREKLDAEKKTKQKRKPKTSASGRASPDNH